MTEIWICMNCYTKCTYAKLDEMIADCISNRIPDIYMDWERSVGSPFSYFTYGAAVSEVEIDCLTGDHQVKYRVFYWVPIDYILMFDVQYSPAPWCVLIEWALYLSRSYVLISWWMSERASIQPSTSAKSRAASSKAMDSSVWSNLRFVVRTNCSFLFWHY